VLVLCGVYGCSSAGSSSGDDERTSGKTPPKTTHSNDDKTGDMQASAGTGATMMHAIGSGGAASSAGDAGMMTSDAGPMHVVPPTPEKPEPCSVSGCPPGLVCESSGVCVTPPPACIDEKDCAADQHCGLTGECLGQGECRVRDDCAEAQTCIMQACMMGSDCGQTQLTIEPIPPNLLVLFDISLSMNDGLDGCMAIPLVTTCDPSKMYVATQVMAQMTTSYRDAIYWGLAEFPGSAANGCGTPDSAIAPGPGNADTVSSQIMNTAPGGFTPINASIKYVKDSTLLSDPTRGNYLLLITDGSETCNEDQGANEATTQRISDMAAIGTKTFVVGFGGGVDADALNDFANAGGVPNTSGSSSYYQADSAAQLESALGAILKRVIGCDFALNATPDDPSKVWAFLDDVMVERDTDDGWKLDTATNTVTFTGASCAMLQAGTVTDIDIVVGCPEPVLD
jgi:hypothetical protein